MRGYKKQREVFWEKNKDVEIRRDMLHMEREESYAAISWTAIQYISPLLKTWGIEHTVYEKEDFTEDMPQKCISGFCEQPYYVVVKSRVKREDLEFLQNLLYKHEFRRKIEDAFNQEHQLKTTVRTVTEEEAQRLENGLA